MVAKLIDLGERRTIALLRRHAITADDKNYQDAFSCKFPKNFDYLVYNLDDLRADLPRENIYGVNKYRVAGRFLVAHTLSDIICSGAKPIGFSTVLTFDDKFTSAALKSFVNGIEDVLSSYGNVRYEMGDTNFSTKSSFVGFGWGAANEESLIRRGGGKPGDLIVTTGKIGGGFAGYVLGEKIYNLSKKSFDQVKEIETNPISFLEPILKSSKLFVGGMDLTDGFYDFIVNQRTISGYGVRIEFSEKVLSPVALEASDILKIRPINFFFEGGYDTPRIHVYTIRKNDFDRAKNIFRDYGVELTVVGELTKDNRINILDSGKVVRMKKLLRDEHRGLEERFIKDWKKVIT